MADKQKVAILYGGRSVEHQISINSAKNVFQQIDKTQFEPVLIGISKTGEWHLKKEVDSDFTGCKPLSLVLDPGNFFLQNGDERVTVDIFFPVLHGTDGEDGSIQGLLQAMDMPFVGTGVLGSSLAMNKLTSKQLFQAANIPVSRYISCNFEDRDTFSFDTIAEDIGLPFMAKAANLGSSVGVVKVKSKNDFDEAMELCFQFDRSVLFEEYIEGRELECSVMGNTSPHASLPAEIIISKDYEFYTYEAKYLDPNAVTLQVPAVLEDNLVQKIQKLSIQAYQALHCDDFARVDLFLTKDNEVLVNEINTIPGFTNSSMFPMMWEERGISFPELITQLITMAQDKYIASKHIEKDYS
ncbi:D-alanine--D-alanine ligase family protein [Fulvivirga sp. M361]|uniref:D-alanine--D-alanine ligase family protein n=1 Tax=Fulvivirga sp. M361 TaxID=2594266 RepID=UPI001625EFBD|nr:D-alanine--D-alanine ligase family protein [Fulvivirga sp. M361]